jgi:hypothetical protein
MIRIKRPVPERVFFGVAAAVLWITACAGLIFFPIGLIFFFLGLPLGLLAAFDAFGVIETRLDDTGIDHRNLIFVKTVIGWNDVSEVRLREFSRTRSDEEGGTYSTDHLEMVIRAGEKKIKLTTPVHARSAWWDDVLALIRQNVPAGKIIG